jgi:hypothetical protein
MDKRKATVVKKSPNVKKVEIIDEI